jgi:hypothetical protein
MDTEKLERLFKIKYKALVVEGDPDVTYDNWVGYCDRHKIFLLDPDWLAETLNEEGLRGRICVHSPEYQTMNTASPWMLVPKKFAERALILGGLP